MDQEVKRIVLEAEDITANNFELYGQIVSPSRDGDTYGDSDAQLDLSRGIPRFYIMHLENRRQLSFESITHHARVTQCLGSSGGHTWYLAVAPASFVKSEQHEGLHSNGTQQSEGGGRKVIQSPSGHSYSQPSPEDVRAFRITGPQLLKLHVGTWHAGPFFRAEAMDFYNLELSDTNVVDHTTHNFKNEDGVFFQIHD